MNVAPVSRRVACQAAILDFRYTFIDQVVRLKCERSGDRTGARDCRGSGSDRAATRSIGLRQIEVDDDFFLVLPIAAATHGKRDRYLARCRLRVPSGVSTGSAKAARRAKVSVDLDCKIVSPNIARDLKRETAILRLRFKMTVLEFSHAFDSLVSVLKPERHIGGEG